MRKSKELAAKAEEQKAREDDALLSKFHARRRAIEATKDHLAEAHLMMIDGLETHFKNMISELRQMGVAITQALDDEIRRAKEDIDFLAGDEEKTQEVVKLTGLKGLKKIEGKEYKGSKEKAHKVHEV